MKSSVSTKMINSMEEYEKFSPSSYDEIMFAIKERVGKRPALPEKLEKGSWTKQAKKVLKERYLQKKDDGKVVETPEEMCWRVVWEIASAEARWGEGRREVTKRAKEFYKLLVARDFLPNSPTLMNAGTGNGLQYSACFVLPVEDSLVGIFDAIKYQALIHQTGGGTGFSFSRLRPNGSVVKSSNGTASGPVSFMRIFDSATNEIKQGGRRRGANMGILRVDHPDVLEFIHCKDDGGITNFNISVAITDKFMKAYTNDADYDLVDPKTKKKVGKLSAKNVFNEIAESAWRTGDPGIVFIDRRNKGRADPVPMLGPIEATNPCGEQELYPYDACNLGSIFLNNFVKEGNGERKVDWDRLSDTVRLATRFLDNVIEVNPFPIDQIRKTVFAIRRIGLGVAGWADMLVELGIAYDSPKALKLASKVMKTIQDTAEKASCDLALERGVFPLWNKSVYKRSGTKRRNATVTTIAPTGSISLIAGASGGIEPLYAIAYQHIVKDKNLDRTLSFINPRFEKVMTAAGLWSDEIRDLVVKKGTIGNIQRIPKEIREVFRTAHEIEPEWHIRMQAAFQKHTENAVSKTINLEKTATEEDVKNAYLLSWKTNCKGITVFRDGCRSEQVLNLGVKSENGELDSEIIKNKVFNRPMVVSGSTYKIQTPVGTAFITVNQDEERNPIEVFINVGRAGSDVQAMAEALGRLISKSLKFGSHLSAKERALAIVDQLKGIGGRRSVGFGVNRIRSLPDAVAVAISTNMGVKINGNGSTSDSVEDANGERKTEDVKIEVPSGVGTTQMMNEKNRKSDHAIYVEPELRIEAIGDICPSCGASSLVYEEGCVKCYSCAHSEC